jgi:hypothetical protein
MMPEDLLPYSEEQMTELYELFQLLKATDDIPKPQDVELGINPLYSWLESMFDNKEAKEV